MFTSGIRDAVSSRNVQPLSPWITGPLVAGAFVALLLLELRRPLRRSRESKPLRQARNFAIAGVGAVAMIAAETPIIQPLTNAIALRRWGLLGSLNLPLWAEVAAALVLMDYTFYIWHWMMHRLPFLWRFHAVHHVDLDLDVSTAARFHFGELLISVPWRAAQVAIIGLTPLTFSIWQLGFALCVLFHHSNVRMPGGVERLVNILLVTPRMHGIHHSAVQQETDSNWSSGLTVWDWLHGTLRLNIPQETITIGVPAYEDPRLVTLPKALAMPFQEQPDYWHPDPV